MGDNLLSNKSIKLNIKWAIYASTKLKAFTELDDRKENRSCLGELRDSLPKTFKEFNQAIGNPVSPVTDKLQDLAPYQISLGECRAKDVQVVKSEKIGITEALLRWIIFMVTKKDCIGYQVMMGAQDLKLAKSNLMRLENIYLNSKILSQFILGEPLKER